ncbi:MotA/TolQ/ExbB proton channel family protein [Candidatus Desantisbacteria bacterium]|nr:MotA/TolQ/ExbB proton channel family protein [Candidatus Desantisbacteria bacterium]
MDSATVIGIIAGFGLMIVAMLMGGQVGIFIDVPSILITVGGMISATLMNYPLGQVLGVFTILKNAFKGKKASPEGIIATMIRFAELSRKEGILSLEKELAKVDDSFLKKGLQLAIDGTNAEELRNIMETELSWIQERHKSNQSVLTAAATYAPAFGMIGTLIGLVQMLKNMSDPTSIGPAMAVALITTYYGSVLANMVFLPLAGKLKCNTSDEVFFKQIMIEGIINIQAGDNPRIVEEKMQVFLSPHERAKLIALRSKK